MVCAPMTSKAGTFAAYLVSAVVGAWFFSCEATEDPIFERRVGIELLMHAYPRRTRLVRAYG
jgi:hypothetical protein